MRQVISGCVLLLLGAAAGWTLARHGGGTDATGHRGTNDASSRVGVAGGSRLRPDGRGTDASAGGGRRTGESALEALRNLAGEVPSGAWNERSYRVMLRLEKDELPAALELLSRPEFASMQEGFESALFRRWGELDGAGAMGAAMLAANPAARERRAASVIATWVSSDLHGALAWFEALPSGTLRRNAMNSVVSGLAGVDPQRALALVRTGDGFNPVDGVSAVLTGWAEKDPAAAAAALSAGDLRVHEHVWGEVARSLAVADMEGAIAWAGQLKPANVRRHAVSQVAMVLAVTDVGRAMELARQLPPGNGRSEVVAQTLQAAAARDLPGTLAFFKAMPEGPERNSALSALGWLWVADDRAGAIDYLNELPQGPARSQMLNNVAIQWADADVPAALAWAQGLKAPAEHDEALRQVVTRWAGMEPDRAADFVRQMPESPAKSQLVSMVSQQVVTSDPKKAVALLQELSPSARVNAAGGMLHQLARQDPEAALQLFEGLPRNLVRSSGLLSSLTSALGESDLPRAVEWAKQLSDDNMKAEALTNLGWNWVQADPAGAVSYATSLPPGSAREQLVGQLAGQWGAVDREAAKAWVTSLPPGSERNRAMVSLVGQWSQQSPESAADFVARMPAGADQDVAVLQVVGNWAGQAPKDTLAWVERFGDENLRAQALTQLVSMWGGNDPESADALLRRQAPGPALDSMASSAALAALRTDPSTAAAWAGLISADENRRQATMRAVAEAWMSRDRTEAERWMRSVAFPESLRAVLLPPLAP